MTKREIIESVLLRVSGGRLSADIDVRREDISVMVAPAIALALDDYLKEQSREEITRLRITGSPGRRINFAFATTYTLTPEYDSTRELYRVELPGRLFVIPQNYGIQMAAPLVGREAYVKVGAQSELAGLPEDTGFVFYWHEVANCKSYIYFDGLGMPVCDVLIKMLLDPSQASEDDELALPAGIEVKAIDMLFAHFSGQRIMSSDIKISDTEEKPNVRQESRL